MSNTVTGNVTLNWQGSCVSWPRESITHPIDVSVLVLNAIHELALNFAHTTIDVNWNYKN